MPIFTHFFTSSSATMQPPLLELLLVLLELVEVELEVELDVVARYEPIGSAKIERLGAMPPVARLQ